MTILILYLYTLDNFLFLELNKGSREGDQSKIETLGPYAAVFGSIIRSAPRHRTDIPDLKNKLEVEGTDLYRGAGIKKAQIDQYKALVGKTEKRNVLVEDKDAEYGASWEEQEQPTLMTLNGFISTSLDRLSAEQFAWSNPETGHEATVF